ncbi:MAG: hypothetical protein ACRD2G_04580 [Terriglobia bacterium]
MISDHRIIQIERQVLAVLFQGFSDGPLDDSLKQRLAGYRWQESDHQAIFSAIVRFPLPSVIAAELPARLTRLGFPDVEWEYLNQPHSLSRSDAAGLIRELLADNKR